MTEKNRGRLVWVDVETTGLDPEKDRIVEIAMVITEANLEPVAAENFVIGYHGDDIRAEQLIALMPDRVLEMHTENGLIEELLSDEGLAGITGAQTELLGLVHRNGATAVALDGRVYRAPMCGSSVHFDRAFVKRWMPELHAAFSYRNIDVSTLLELAERWAPDLIPERPASPHRALDDCMRSIELAQHFQPAFKLWGEA